MRTEISGNALNVCAAMTGERVTFKVARCYSLWSQARSFWHRLT